MNRIWANRLIAGTQTYSAVPASRKEAVKEILLQDLANHIITEERYLEILDS